MATIINGPRSPYLDPRTLTYEQQIDYHQNAQIAMQRQMMAQGAAGLGSAQPQPAKAPETNKVLLLLPSGG